MKTEVYGFFSFLHSFFFSSFLLNWKQSWISTNRARRTKETRWGGRLRGNEEVITMSRCSFSEINFVTRYNPDPLNATNVTMYNFISVNSFKISFLFFFFPPPPPRSKSIRTFEKLKLNYIKTDKKQSLYIYIFFSKNNSVYSSNFIGIRTCANTSNGRNRNVQDCWQFTAATIIDAYPIRYVIGPSIERPTSNFCTRSRDTIGIDDPAHRSDQPPVLFFFLLSFFFPPLFRFRNAVFSFHPDGHILRIRGRIYFWKRIKQISEGIFTERRRQAIHLHRLWNVPSYKSVYFRGEKLSNCIHAMQLRHYVSYAFFFLKTRGWIWFSRYIFETSFQGKEFEPRTNSICQSATRDEIPPIGTPLYSGVTRIPVWETRRSKNTWDPTR